jgi:hypothetical protein
MKRRFGFAAVVAACLAVPAVAGAHELFDHAPPGFVQQGAPSTQFRSGGEGAKWEFVASFPTGNPHSDLDFFTQGGETFASVGTLAAGPNAGGQTIFQLTQGGQIAPKFVSSHPSASCVSRPDNALGLQHDTEATPKGNAILNTDVTNAVRRDTQLIIDATDQDGRCHDQGTLGVASSPQGGLEIIDVTNPAAPKEIGMTSHIGEAHTVNIDPKRPHIAYAVTSDSVSVDREGKRSNESGTSLSLDGFEVVDLSSCMNFPAGATLQQKRDACKPQVWRYRYPDTEIALGHSNKGSLYACHELEIYPDDRLTCGSGAAAILFDMSGAFDDRGTPADFTDDKPRGTPLPCAVRPSSTTAPAFASGASVVDCVRGVNNVDLGVPNWLKIGAPSLAGVRHLGSAFHMGREGTGQTQPRFNSKEDIDFDHEAELSHSGQFVLATDERGGGVAPPGASCSPEEDITAGNGGVHAYRVDSLLDRTPGTAARAFQSYARTPEGEKAIFRAEIQTQPQDSLCTAHVFHQIPGQNRIFMAWYSQGTRVLDFFENPDGTIEFKEAGWFIPANADQWSSAIFKVDANPDGTFTYYGTAGDFNLGNAGRNAVDIYKVTLPAPPLPASFMRGVGRGFAPSSRSSCLRGTSRLGSRGLSLLRLGLSYAQTVQRQGNPLRRRGRVFRYCVTGGGRRGRVIAVFDTRNKVRLIASTHTGHRARGVRRGTSLRRFRRVYRNARRIGRGVYLTSRSSRIVVGVRRNRVSFVGVADRRLVKNTRSLRRYLRLARLR